jgi:predicted ATPase
MIHSFDIEGTEEQLNYKIELDQDKRVYCFIGENGVGKTKLLEHMVKSLIYRSSIFYRGNNKKYSNILRHGDSFNILKDYKLKLALNILINNIEIKNKDNKKWSITSFENIYLNDKNSFICDKPIVYIGAKSRGHTKNIDTEHIKLLPSKDKIFVEAFTRTYNYINNIGLENEEIADWFVSRLLINEKLILGYSNKFNEVISLLILIEKLSGIKLYEYNEDKKVYEILVFIHDGKLYINNIPIDKFSTGYMSIIKIFQEILVGYSGWTHEEDLANVEGIVFIDEIEAHLHLSWQTKVIDILKESFPNTTFYITTHSPMVLSGLQDGEAYNLKRDENNLVTSNRLDNIDEYFINDILKEFFNIDLEGNKLDKIDMNKQKKAKEALKTLLSKLSEKDK